ncbi:MAG: nucleotidyltransferase family protein [Pyrinomonadaceae bacterium]
MSDKSNVVAILLAAGRSSRMGAFKPLLPFGERTVVESCISNLVRGGIKKIVVVIGHRAGDVRERLARSPVRFALNLDEESEMSVSIRRGVEQVPMDAGALMIALVDQPAVPPEVIKLLIDEWKRKRARVVVPEYEGRGGHPVLIDRSLREELLRLNSQKGLRGLFDAHRKDVLRVPVTSAYVARDMDTWEDYCALYRSVFGLVPPDERAVDKEQANNGQRTTDNEL